LNFTGRRAGGAVIGVTGVVLTTIHAGCCQVPAPPIGGTDLDLIRPDALRISSIAAVTIARNLIG
jgi:hypothetical protein